VSDSPVAMGLFAGAETMLARLQEQGILLAVATGKSRRGLDRILDDLTLRRRFAATRCADDTCSKPDPLMLQEILAQLRIPASRALMVG
ncbi:HAD family hydrolase, partial [Gilvimarinus sp. 1_MG-2023]|uniref:HAD family hydrolase n=1 Tax=Gilvimarinus sp. 1_MG-2023 TaxID=3062638 RepID=UPI0026E370E8